MAPRADIQRQLLERDSRFAGNLGAILYVVSGLVVLATSWMLPPEVDQAPLIAMAMGAVLVGALLPTLPWERWSHRPAFAVVVLAHTQIAVAGWWVPGSVEHYLPLYVMSYLYVGMTQAPLASLLVAPLTIASFLVATAGGTTNLVNFVALLPLAVVAAEVLSRLLARQHQHLDEIALVLDATKRLVAAADVDDAARVIGELTLDLLHPELVTVLVADRNQPSRFVSRMQSDGFAPLGTLVLDVLREASGIATAVRNGQTTLIADAATSTAVSRRLVEATDAGSVVYVPLMEQTTAVGAIVGVWHRAGKRLDVSSTQVMDLVAAEVGPILSRLRDRDRLSWEAETDPLTGIANRRTFNRALDASQHGDALVMIDLDHFKQVNDRFGHAEGDEVLRVLAQSLTHAAREGDCVSRFGGEEFAAVLVGAGVEGSRSFLARVREQWTTSNPPTTFSAGFAVRGEAEAPLLTLGRADAALYMAKDGGRNLDVEAPAATLTRQPSA